MENMLRTIEWKDGKVVMIDQTKLPTKLELVEYSDHMQVADAIKNLVVRGAPAIGVSGAFGLALAAQNSTAITREEIMRDIESAAATLKKTRPTAVNLAWALERIIRMAKTKDSADSIRTAVLAEAQSMAEEDISANMQMGEFGSDLIQENDTIMTHCNAGALATVAYGTALGVIRASKEKGRKIRVVATETRPVRQGSRLTAFELKHDGIDVSLIPDTAVGYSMAKGMIDKVIVGADRILRTGHVYNKIGTFQVAVMARNHDIPFYVAAPLSTFDMDGTPDDIIIEHRNPDEVTGTGASRTAPDGIPVINPAFDMTPPELVSGIITERGVAVPPYTESIPRLFQANF